MHRPSRTIALAGAAGLAVALASSCSSEDDDPRPRETAFTTTDSAGVTLLVTTPAGDPPSAGWTIDSEPAMVFGESRGSSVEFHRIEGAIRLASGTIVVLDSGADELMYFAPSGELLSVAGGEGDGPGEFRDPSGPVAMGDTVLVYDRGHRRVTLFDGDGALVAEHTLGTVEGASPNIYFLYGLADAANNAITLTSDRWEVPAFGPGRDSTLVNPTLRFEIDGAYLGEVGEPGQLQLYGTSGGRVMKLFTRIQSAHANAGRIFVADTEAYEVRVYGADGDLARIFRLLKQRKPVREEDVARYVEWLSEQVEDPEQRRSMVEGVADQPRADSFPSLSGVRIDALGGIWVDEYTPRWKDHGETAVFAPDGRWLGTVEMPADFEPLDIGEDSILGVFTDELDVEHLRMYRLER